MSDPVSTHYGGGGGLADRITDSLRKAGLEPGELHASDLEALDEFHFRGREATVELLEHMNLLPGFRVLDIGSGLGGVSRTIAEATGAHVTGVDLTQELCDAAGILSDWVGLGDKTEFHQGNATDLPFDDCQFDAAVTFHVAMNILDKTRMYEEARRVLKKGARFGIYDILQGEGGDVLYPTPWATDQSTSHLSTPNEMSRCLLAAGFRIIHEVDSTNESHRWLNERTKQPKPEGSLPVTTQLLFGGIAREMTENQLLGLRERRMLTYSFVCET